MTSYKNLVVWQRSIELTCTTYLLTGSFSEGERYGLVSQMRRAAISVASNIAEGYSRRLRREYARFVQIAFGSGAELETQIVLAKKLGFASEQECAIIDKQLDEVMRMLNRLIAALRGSDH